jgi:hypothetical protein
VNPFRDYAPRPPPPMGANDFDDFLAHQTANGASKDEAYVCAWLYFKWRDPGLYHPRRRVHARRVRRDWAALWRVGRQMRGAHYVCRSPGALTLVQSEKSARRAWERMGRPR